MRTSGVLMPISSLPSPYGIGTMGKSARKFVDFLVKGGQTYWQILPICPTSYGDSPYQSFSSFAGNPYFIDLDILCKENLLKKKECESFDWGTSEEYIDYGTMYVSRYALLHKAYARFVKNMPEDFSSFCEAEKDWLEDYTLFMALKDANDGKAWGQWDEKLRVRDAAALDEARKKYAEDIEFYKMLQYLFFKQWRELKAYANENGIEIIGDSIYRIHNIPTVVLGASLLMFGWFGFNAGSALAADGLAAHAFMTTGVSAAAAMLSWMLCDVIKNKKPTLIGASTGMVAGLVGITPGAGFVPMWAAVIIGLTTSPVCYIMISYGKKKFGFDDALDAFSCHGTGGIWGGLLTGVFSCTAINSSAGNGLVYGEFAQFGAQAAGIGITIVIAVVGTLICYGITRLLTGKIRVDLRDELMGLDVSQHGEAAYPSFNGLDN